MIAVRGLSKRHGTHRVLEALSAEVATGEIIAVVGPSGGGKSTLLRCLNYLEPFDDGEVEIAGFRLVPGLGRESRGMLRRLRAAVGMVFQELNLFPHRTALENVALAPRVVRGVERVEAEEAARELLARVGLGDRAGAYPHQLSGGQQQRVAIARALAQKPQVMLFDEPTSALDPEMREDVMQVLRSLASSGMTMLVVTHEMHFAHDVASRVWVIDHGTIVEDGTPDQVVDAPRSKVARDYFARLRHVLLPQALRLALPAMTNDFVALLKDSSLVSVITVIELTKRMTIAAVDLHGWLVPGLACAALYLAMSYPLSELARCLERRLNRDHRPWAL